MSSHISGISNPDFLPDSSQSPDASGYLGHRKVESSSRWKPLFIILIVLGVCGIAAAGVGLAGMGGSQFWWSAGLLNHLGQVNSIVAIAVGGGPGVLLIVGGVIGFERGKEVYLFSIPDEEKIADIEKSDKKEVSGSESLRSSVSIYESADEIDLPEEILVDRDSLPANLSLLNEVLCMQSGGAIDFEVEGESFSAWHEDETIVILNCINGQLKMTLSPGKDKISSIQVDEKEIENIPQRFVAPLDMAFKKALELSSSYTIHRFVNLEIAIWIVRRGLQVIPEYHLSEFSARLMQIINEKGMPTTSVTYLNDDRSPAIGMDRGGLSRDYFARMFMGLCKSPSLSFQKVPSGFLLPITKKEYDVGQSLPTLDEEELQRYHEIGEILMYCYDSGALSGYFNKTYAIGRHFDDALFNVILSLSSEEVDTPFEQLSLETKLKMCVALAHAQKEKTYMRWFGLLSKKDPSKSELKEMAMVLIAEEMLPEKLLDADADPDWKKIETEMEELKPSTNGNGIPMRKLIVTAFQDYVLSKKGSLGPLGAQLAPIHAIAQGMKAVQPVWGLVCQLPYAQFSDRIQGSIDRKAIANQFYFGNTLSGNKKKEIEKKANWLKEWILDEKKGATIEEIKNLLEFLTGAPCLVPKQRIKIKTQIEHFTPVPTAHTCTLEMELSPVPCKMGEYNDEREEEFIKALKALVLQNPDGFQMD